MIFSEIIKKHGVENVTGYDLALAILHLPHDVFTPVEQKALATIANSMGSNDALICIKSNKKIIADSNTSHGTLTSVIRKLRDFNWMVSIARYDENLGQTTSKRAFVAPIVDALVSIVAFANKGKGWFHAETHAFAAEVIHKFVDKSEGGDSDGSPRPDQES